MNERVASRTGHIVNMYAGVYIYTDMMQLACQAVLTS
jgi:hypothetical protein